MKNCGAWCAVVAAFLLASCASPIERRIEKNPDAYNQLNDHQKEMVRHGAVEEGMSKEAVLLAWGKPDQSSKGSRMGKSFERWSYAGYNPVFYGPSGPGIYDPYYNKGPGIDYLPYEKRWAEFLNDRVFAWSIAK